MKILYCLPVIKNTKEEVFEMIQNNIEYEYFEVWLDYIENLDESFVKNIIEQFGEKLIFVFRRKNLEPVKLSLKKRFEIIELFNKSLSLVDLDIFKQKEELEQIENNGLTIRKIVSYHNYDTTPSDEKLKEIIDTMKPYNPDIFKIATKCNNQKDALRLLELLLAMKEKQVKCIVLGMGEFGAITRIFGTLWGNEMIFAPGSKTENSAEGQFAKQDLQKIFEILYKN